MLAGTCSSVHAMECQVLCQRQLPPLTQAIQPTLTGQALGSNKPEDLIWQCGSKSRQSGQHFSSMAESSGVGSYAAFQRVIHLHVKPSPQ